MSMNPARPLSVVAVEETIASGVVAVEESIASGVDAVEAAVKSVQVALPLTPADRKLRVINLMAVLVPIAGLIAAVILTWGSAMNWTVLIVSLVVGVISSFGITVGYHRLCTHKSFETPGFMRYLFAAAGSIAVQGPVIHWCGEHRRHHQHSDTEGDPHSPHMSDDGSWGEGVWATLRGAYHAHMGWMLEVRGRGRRGVGRYTRDLREDRALVAADKQFVWWVLLGLFAPAVVCGLIMMSWYGALLGFLWGGLVRILVVHHITWSVNSVCHLWGSQPFETHDESRNNPIVGLLAMGEGWHNNHHAFPTSARHGLRWWQPDLSYLLIRTLGLIGLAKRIKVPSRERIMGKKPGREAA